MSLENTLILNNMKKKQLVCFNNEMMRQMNIFKYLGGNNLVYNNYSLNDQSNTNFAQIYNNFGVLTISASNLFVPNSIQINGNVTFSNNLTTSGLIVSNNMSIKGNLNISNNISISGNLKVKGNIIQTENNYTFLPAGTIVVWFNTPETIPSGWAYCNGQTVNGYTTPNLISSGFVYMMKCF